jgi:hypothetical protein
MSKSLFRLAILSFACGLMVVGSAAAQDFQKSYRLGAGGDVRIGNVSGNVTVTGYDGDAVVVTAIKEGPDRDKVEIEDKSTGDRVDVSVRYPERCNCHVDVRFEVKVPRSISYDFRHISSVSGDVEVSSVTGKLHASSVSGTVRVKDVTGSVSATAVSGNVEVDIDRLEGTGKHEVHIGQWQRQCDFAQQSRCRHSNVQPQRNVEYGLPDRGEGETLRPGPLSPGKGR